MQTFHFRIKSIVSFNKQNASILHPIRPILFVCNDPRNLSAVLFVYSSIIYCYSSIHYYSLLLYFHLLFILSNHS